MDPVMYRTAGGATLPSPIIWADCNRSDILDMGTGYWFHEEFLGVPNVTAAGKYTIGNGVVRPKIGPFQFAFDTDDDTVIEDVAVATYGLGGVIGIETDGDDNDGFCIYTAPFCKTVKNSGNRWWLEGRIAINDADGDQGFAFGLGEEACFTVDLIDNGGADLMDETFIGFRILTGEDAIDAVAQLDDGAEVAIADADVTANTAVTGYAALADNTFYKLGMRFDGKETVYTYVGGYEVGQWTLDTDYFDKDKNLGCVLVLKTGADAEESIKIDWARGAYEIVS